MDFKISRQVEEKLRDRHGVSRKEIIERFFNRSGPPFQDTRANHQTDPPTFWLVSETDVGRVLKIVYIQRGQDFIIKTAYEPKDGSDVLYQRLCARRRN